MKLGPFTISHRVYADDAKEVERHQGLHVAAMQDDLPALRALFAEGLDFQVRDDKMRALLHLAHRVETVAFLLECGCEPLALDVDHCTTLMHHGLEADANKLLLAHGVDIHARDRYGSTALFNQCDFSGIGWDNPDLNALKVLLEADVTDGNEAEIEAVLRTAAGCVTSAGEQMDVLTLENFLRSHQHAS